MKIVKPEIHLSDFEKRLIRKLARLLVEEEQKLRLTHNHSADLVVLSNEEAQELIRLINLVIEKEGFVQSAYFIEKIMGSADTEKEVRNIYLGHRKQRGRSRAMASNHWADFRGRLGALQSWHPGSRSTPMSKEHFLKMEQTLFLNVGMNANAVPLLMALVEREWDAFEDYRAESIGLPKNSVRGSLEQLQYQLKDGIAKKINMSSAITLVSNSAVLFTTRDWSVTGTISAMIGASCNLKRS